MADASPRAKQRSIRFTAGGVVAGAGLTASLYLELAADPEGGVAALLGFIIAIFTGALAYAYAAMRPLDAERPPRPGAALVAALLSGFSLAFVAQHLVGAVTRPLLPRVRGLLEAGALAPSLVPDDQTWRLLTAPLLHADSLHFTLSMGALVAIVARLRRRLDAWLTASLVLTPALLATAAIGALVPQGLLTTGSAAAFAGYGALLVAERTAYVADLRDGPAWWYWLGTGFALMGTAISPYAHGGVHLLAAGLGAGLAALVYRLRPLAGPTTRLGPAGPLLLAATICAHAAGLVFAIQSRARPIEARAQDLVAIVPSLTDTKALNSAAWKTAVDPDAAPHELELAYRLSERTLELEPESSAFLDTLATLHHRRGEHLVAAQRELDAAGKVHNPFFWGQLQRFLRSARAELGHVPRVGAHGPDAIGLELIGWSLVMWWPTGTAPTVVAAVESPDDEPLGSVILVATSSQAGSHRYGIPEDLGEHLDADAHLTITWIRERHPDWPPGLWFIEHDPDPAALP